MRVHCAIDKSDRHAGARRMERAIVFDFDLTLADSTKGVIECVNFALDGIGLPRVDDERIRQTIGLSLKATFQILTGRKRSGDVDGFVSRFVERADQVMADLTTVFDCVPCTTARLIETGFELGIVSTKFRYRIEDILKREGLSDRFGVIVGGEDVTEHKPHPEGLLTAVTRLRMKTGNAYYVGDSMVDALTAELAGIPFVAVLTGTTGKNEFNELPHIAVVDDVSALPRLFDGR